MKKIIIIFFLFENLSFMPVLSGDDKTADNKNTIERCGVDFWLGNVKENNNTKTQTSKLSDIKSEKDNIEAYYDLSKVFNQLKQKVINSLVAKTKKSLSIFNGGIFVFLSIKDIVNTFVSSKYLQCSLFGPLIKRNNTIILTPLILKMFDVQYIIKALEKTTFRNVIFYGIDFNKRKIFNIKRTKITKKLHQLLPCLSKGSNVLFTLIKTKNQRDFFMLGDELRCYTLIKKLRSDKNKHFGCKRHYTNRTEMFLVGPFLKNVIKNIKLRSKIENISCPSLNDISLNNTVMVVSDSVAEIKDMEIYRSIHFCKNLICTTTLSLNADRFDFESTLITSNYDAKDKNTDLSKDIKRQQIVLLKDKEYGLSEQQRPITYIYE